MHIHLPKPLHGWREFVGEVGVIVLGIFTALALEQLIESFHEARIGSEARESVRAEVRENLFWIGLRELREPCVKRRLADINDLLRSARKSFAQTIRLKFTLPCRVRRPISNSGKSTFHAGQFELV